MRVGTTLFKSVASLTEPRCPVDPRAFPVNANNPPTEALDDNLHLARLARHPVSGVFETLSEPLPCFNRLTDGRAARARTDPERLSSLEVPVEQREI